jgi:hypothetical protein
MKIGNVILLALVFVIPILSFSQQEKSFKLLIYLSFEDSIKLQSSDTNLINSDICIKLHVDTIDMAFLKKDTSNKMESQPNNWFIYKGKYMRIFLKNQLYDLSEYNMLKNYELKGYDFVHSGNQDRTNTCFSNCMPKGQKETIKQLQKRLQELSWNGYYKIWMDHFNVVNNITKKTLDLPQISFKLTKITK